MCGPRIFFIWNGIRGGKVRVSARKGEVTEFFHF